MPDLAGAIVGHLAGDYLLQNDFLAIGKKNSSLICALHCAIWTAAVAALGGMPLWTWPVLFVTHFVQDRWLLIPAWMKAIGQAGFRDGPCSPWAAIVVDNVWHILAIYAMIAIAGRL